MHLITIILALTTLFAPQERDTLSVSQPVRKPIIGLSTNVLYDVTYLPGYGLTSIPSFSLEFYPGKSAHWTLGLDFETPWWKHPDTHRYLQINNLTLWTRRYFRTRACEAERFGGLYLLGNLNAARYGIGFDEKGWQGEGLGASLGVGYKWTLGERCYLDLGLAAGAFFARQDPYFWGNDANKWYYYDFPGSPDEFVERWQGFFWGGPTRIYFSIGIDLFKKPKKQ